MKPRASHTTGSKECVIYGSRPERVVAITIAAAAAAAAAVPLFHVTASATTLFLVVKNCP